MTVSGRSLPKRVISAAPSAELVERGLDRPDEALAGLGQAHLAGLALEQRLAQPFLQRLDLVADGAVGHVQLGRRLGEALQAGGGLEIMHGFQGRKAHRTAFLMCQFF